MNKKNETILIRLDTDTKEAFRSFCESCNSTMTDIISEQIKKMLLNSESMSENSDLHTVIKERNFYKKELDIHKQIFNEVNKKINTLNKNSLIEQDTLYCEILFDNFAKIKQFYGFELIKKKYFYSAPDFIAFNKSLNRKILIDFRSGSLDDILIGPKGKYYKQLCDRFKDENTLELVIINFSPAYEETTEKINKLSRKIGYDITVYNFDELFDFLNVKN
jgi:antitoxin component of RelBE/YafQ-DinJ toxin-antitoxin module